MSKEKNKSVNINTESVEIREEPRRHKKKKGGINTAKAVTLTAVSVLAAGSIIGLSVALHFSQEKLQYQARYIASMDAVYSRAYYDLLDGANDLDVKLRKVEAAASRARQQALLYEIWGVAGLAEKDLNSFKSDDEGLMKASKFMNQLGDYSHSLALRIADGDTLGEREYDTLAKLSDVAEVFKQSLKKVQSGLDAGRLFVEEGGNVVGDFSDAFGEFADPAMEYPEMIYDGPFSDALETRVPKALTGADITEEQGAELVAKYFAVRGVSDIGYQGSTKGNIETYNYTFSCDGGEGFCQLAKKGGMMVAFNMLGDEAQAAVSEPECCKAALAFVADMGYKSLEVVWTATANGICYVNLAPVSEGVILYPDLIKVKVDPASGNIIGADMTHYIYNHTDRDIPEPAITLEEAAAKVKLPVTGSGRLALIPLQETKEKLTYEFECEKDGTYFVYIDAVTGEEADILYVIDTAQGTVLQ